MNEDNYSSHCHCSREVMLVSQSQSLTASVDDCDQFRLPDVSARRLC